MSSVAADRAKRASASRGPAGRPDRRRGDEMDRRTFLAAAALPALSPLRSARSDQAHRRDDSRRRVPHQRAPDVCRADVQRQADRRAPDERPRGSGHLRRLEWRDRAALGLPGHEALGRGSKHQRVHRGDGGVEAPRRARVHHQPSGRQSRVSRRTRTRCRSRSRRGGAGRGGSGAAGGRAARRERCGQRTAGGRRTRRGERPDRSATGELGHRS